MVNVTTALILTKRVSTTECARYSQFQKLYTNKNLQNTSVREQNAIPLKFTPSNI